MSTTPATSAPDLDTLAADLGLTLTASNGRGHYDASQNWTPVRFDCTLTRNGREVWSGHYNLGTGHLKTLTAIERANGKLPRNAAPTQAQLAALTRNAAAERLQPKLADVLHSLLSDGAAFFDGLTFEDWANEYGFDTDSRKAEATFRECDAIGRKLAKAFKPEELEALRNAAAEH
jgi:hypothetical protein